MNLLRIIVFGLIISESTMALGATFFRSASFYRNRELRIFLENFPVTEACEDETAVSAFVIDESENDNEFSDLKKGICLFHRTSKSVTGPSEGDNLLDKNQRSIDHLVGSQNRGLPPQHQAYATLLEGLANCRRAKIFYPRYQTELAGGGTQENLIGFCSARKKASIAFSDIDWTSSTHKVIQAPEGVIVGLFTTPTEVTSLISEMTQCFGQGDPSVSPLASGTDGAIDALCSDVTPSKDEIIAISKGVVTDSIVPKYLEGARAPLTAMLQRKQERTASVHDSAQAALNVLVAEAQSLDATYQDFKGQLDAALPAADQAVNDYTDAASDAFSVRDSINYWSGTVLSGEINGQTSLAQINQSTQAIDGLLAASEPLRDQLVDLKAKVESSLTAQDDKLIQIREMCEIWACEVLRKKHKDSRRTLCDDSEFREGNFLCQGADAEVPARTEGGSPRSVAQLCQDMTSMDPTYFVENRRVGPGDQCFQDSTQPLAEPVTPEPDVLPSNLSLTYFNKFNLSTLSFERVYVGIMVEPNPQGGDDIVNAYRLQDCSLERAHETLQIPLGQVIESTFYLSLWWNDLNENPYISCTEGDYDQDNLPNTQDDPNSSVLFTKVGQERTFYVRGEESSSIYYSFSSQCVHIKNRLGLAYPNRRFQEVVDVPSGEIRKISCGNDLYETIGGEALAADQWKLYFVEPESGWTITNTINGEECQLGQNSGPGVHDNKLGAFVLAYNGTYLPVVKVDGCYLNEFSTVDRGIRHELESSIRKHFGMSTTAIAGPLPDSLKVDVEKNPLFDICVNDSLCDKVQQKRYQITSVEADGSKKITQLADIDSDANQTFSERTSVRGERTFQWILKSATQADRSTKFVFHPCNFDLAERLGFAIDQSNPGNSEWYESMDFTRKVKNIPSLQRLQDVPCIRQRTCVIELTSLNLLDLDTDAIVDRCIQESESEGLQLAETLEVRIKQNITVIEPLVFRGETVVDHPEGVQPPPSLNAFKEVVLTGDPGVEITSAVTCITSSEWCDDFRAKHQKLPTVALLGVENLLIKDLTIKAAIPGQTMVFASNGTKVAFENVTTSSTSQRFERLVVAKHDSEVYMESSDLYSYGTGAAIYAGRLAIHDTFLTSDTKALHISSNSESYVFESTIEARSPIVMKGYNVEAGVPQMQVFESSIKRDVKNDDPGADNYCVQVQWGTQVELNQVMFDRCKFSASFVDDLTFEGNPDGEAFLRPVAADIKVFETNSGWGGAAFPVLDDSRYNLF